MEEKSVGENNDIYTYFFEYFFPPRFYKNKLRITELGDQNMAMLIINISVYGSNRWVSFTLANLFAALFNMPCVLECFRMESRR